MPHRPPHLIEALVNANGFPPEPAHGALITGLLDAVASEPVRAEPLAQACAEGLSAVVGDTCIVSLLDPRCLEPIALADPLEEAVTVLRPLLHRRLPAGGATSCPRTSSGSASEPSSRRRCEPRPRAGSGRRTAARPARPFAPGELRLVQAVADVVALGLEGRRVPAGNAGDPPEQLSSREREVLTLLALGHTNREIAERLHLSVRTVEWHRARIQSKLHVTGRAALAQIARRHGLVGGTTADPWE